jgi:hypothetical protein
MQRVKTVFLTELEAFFNLCGYRTPGSLSLDLPVHHQAWLRGKRVMKSTLEYGWRSIRAGSADPSSSSNPLPPHHGNGCLPARIVKEILA